MINLTLKKKKILRLKKKKFNYQVQSFSHEIKERN